jgi:anti-anti-sigma regulatory factor
MNTVLETPRPMPSLIQEVTFARVEEPFTSETAVRVKESLSPLLVGPGHVVLDLRSAQMDGVGLGALLSLQRKLELQGRALFVVTTDPAFGALIEAAGAGASLTLFSEMDQAIHEAKASGSHAYAA